MTLAKYSLSDCATLGNTRFKLLILISILLLTSLSLGQDSLATALQALPDGEEKAKSFRNAGYELITTDVDLALDYLHRAHGQFHFFENDTFKAKIIADISYAFIWLGELDSAMIYGLDAYDIYASLGNDEGIAYVNTQSLISVLSQVKQYNEATERSHETIQYYRKQQIKGAFEADESVGAAYNTLALNYYRQDMLDSTLKYLEKSFENMLKSPNLDSSEVQRNLSVVLTNFGTLLVKKGELGKAQEYLRRAERLMNRHGSIHSFAYLHMELARVYLKLNDPVQSMLSMSANLLCIKGFAV